MMRPIVVLTVSLSIAAFAAAADKTEEGFIRLDDGKTIKGWKISENPESWSIKDGAFVANGNRSHLFYIGDDKPFKNFELRVDVLTRPGSNGGIYFHSEFQDVGWPKYGFEAQVNNSYIKDPQKTGSLYAVVKVLDDNAKDDEWYTETVIVKGNKIVIKVNEKVVVDYTEPADYKPADDYPRKIDEGTFALQAHDPGSTVYFKNIRVKRLD
jgi:hypothetical protein